MATFGRELPISLSIFNNGTAMPGGGYLGVFSKTVHPGLTLGTYHSYRKSKQSDLFQTIKLGYFYHRHAQHAIQLYTELGYRHNIYRQIYAEALFGVGYLHSIADLQQFKFDNGKYVPLNSTGRPQAMVAASLIAGYNLQQACNIPLKLFVQYQFGIQTPFVNKYVPLLPNAAFHIGGIYTLTTHKSKTL